MDYFTSAEMSKLWGISSRRISLLCSDGRIHGAEKKGKTWLIPKNADKPADPRRKSRRKNEKMSKIILYHGSPDQTVVPTYGLGDDKHDYGRGFYLTEDYELGREWAVCRPNDTNGWLHKYELDADGLKILDFQRLDVLCWLAELMKHRDAADSRRYHMLAGQFIEKYGMDIAGYDVIRGWRADASYFYIAREFVRDNIDIDILEELLSFGDLGIQYCIKSEKAYSQLKEVTKDLVSVEYEEFNMKYNERDSMARQNMRKLMDSDANKVMKVFSTLFGR